MAGRHFYEFGPYRLDVLTQRLLRDDQPVPLTPKAFDTLLLLVRNPQRTLDKRELMKALWPETFVEESNLSQQMFTLRKLLGEQPGGGPYIETVPKRGYHFAAPVAEIRDEPADLAPSSRGIVGALLGLPRTRLAAVVAVVALAVAGTLWWLQARRSAGVASGAAFAPVRSLAVLPLANLSGEPGQDYLADGMTDTLIANLAQISRLRVISRTSVMTYKGARKPLPEIARELNVDAIVEGSVQRSGSRLRLNIQLIQASTDRHLWAQTYERDLQDALLLQSEVARAIASEIRVALTPEEGARLAQSRPLDPKVYEAYLKGRYFWNRRTEEGARRATEHFEDAIRADPAYAPAYAGLADSYVVLAQWAVPGDEAWPRAKAAAEKAVQLDDSLAEGHTSRATVARNYEWDWARADKEYRRALELNPGYANAHHWYGYYLMLMGRLDEAEAELKRAQELDPLSLIINANIGFRLYVARQYDAAIAHWLKTLEMDPNFWLLHSYLGLAYVQKEMYSEAVAAFQKGIAVSGAPSDMAVLAHTYGRMGKTQEARKLLAELHELSKRRFIPAFYISLVHVGLGETDKAFEWLEKAYQERSGPLNELKADPMFDPLRTDPRFAALLRRMGLPT